LSGPADSGRSAGKLAQRIGKYRDFAITRGGLDIGRTLTVYKADDDL
jgi:hypothetical protein